MEGPLVVQSSLTLLAAWQADTNIPTPKKVLDVQSHSAGWARYHRKAVEFGRHHRYSEQTLLEKLARYSRSLTSSRHPADPAASCARRLLGLSVVPR